MTTKYRTGIQKQVLHLIDYGCNVMKLPYITMDELKEELKQPNETDEILNHRLTQATYQLKKNGQIKDKGYGKYGFNSDQKKYYSKCAHLEDKEQYCPIKKKYVQPDESCVAIDDYDGTQKTTMTKCSGYSTGKTKEDVKHSQAKLQQDEAKDIGACRYHTVNQYDPQSKYYLPNLAREL